MRQLSPPTAKRGHHFSPTIGKRMTVPKSAKAARALNTASIPIQLKLERRLTPKRCARSMRSQTASRESPEVVRRMILDKIGREGLKNIIGALMLSVVRKLQH